MKNTNQQLSLYRELGTLTDKLKQHLPISEKDIDEFLSEVKEALIISFGAKTMSDIRQMPADLRMEAAQMLIYGLDTTTKFKPGDKGYFCLDWHGDELEKPGVFDALLADQSVETLEDIVRWLEGRYKAAIHHGRKCRPN